MGADPRRQGPAAPDAARWRTLPAEVTVLAVARTLTSAIRLLEALAVFRGDSRVNIVFTADPGSRFASGVPELLRSARAAVVEWDQVRHLDHHLVLAASEHVDFGPMTRAPILVLPHGIGFHKHVPDVDGTGVRLSGLVRAKHLRDRDVHQLITHPDQADQLARACPESRGRTVLGGDLSYDALLFGAELREHYREHLGLMAGQRLITLTSTWGKQSLLGTQPELAARLLASIPCDEAKIACIAHPNAWTWHRDLQIRAALDEALRAGLLLVPPTAGWHATVVASDLVIGDHGSVGLYSALIGRPFLLGAFGEEAVPGTPVVEFGQRATLLHREEDLAGQLDKAIATQRPDQYADLAERLFTHAGVGQDRLQEICYGLLGLSLPAHPAPPLAPPAPELAPAAVASFEVEAQVLDGATITLSRFPSAVRGRRSPAREPIIRHLAVAEGERAVRLLDNASVIARERPAAPEDGHHWLTSTLAKRKCRVAATASEDGCLVALRDGRRLVVSGLPEALLAGSLVYALLLADQLRDGDFLLHLGTRSLRCSVRAGAQR